MWVWKNVSNAADSACFIPAMRCVKPGFTNSALRPEIGCVRTTGCLLEMTSPVVSPGTNAARGALWTAVSDDAISCIFGESAAYAASRSSHIVSPP